MLIESSRNDKYFFSIFCTLGYKMFEIERAIPSDGRKFKSLKLCCTLQFNATDRFMAIQSIIKHNKVTFFNISASWLRSTVLDAS